MEYLVLRSFTSYGKLLKKGTIVDETEIRNPRLRRSEKKIYPVVSSSKTADEVVDDAKTPFTPPQQPLNNGEETKIKLGFNLNKNLSLG